MIVSLTHCDAKSVVTKDFPLKHYFVKQDLTMINHEQLGLCFRILRPHLSINIIVCRNCQKTLAKVSTHQGTLKYSAAVLPQCCTFSTTLKEKTKINGNYRLSLLLLLLAPAFQQTILVCPKTFFMIHQLNDVFSRTLEANV